MLVWRLVFSRQCHFHRGHDLVVRVILVLRALLCGRGSSFGIIDHNAFHVVSWSISLCAPARHYSSEVYTSISWPFLRLLSIGSSFISTPGPTVCPIL